jgi:hypothetical protein
MTWLGVGASRRETHSGERSDVHVLRGPGSTRLRLSVRTNLDLVGQSDRPGSVRLRVRRPPGEVCTPCTGSTFDRLSEPARASTLDAIEELLRPSLSDLHGQWTADYVRLRFSAAKS